MSYQLLSNLIFKRKQRLNRFFFVIIINIIIILTINNTVVTTANNINIAPKAKSSLPEMRPYATPDLLYT